MFGTEAAFLLALSTAATLVAAIGGVIVLPDMSVCLATAADGVAIRSAIMEDNMLRLFCFIGAMGGAWASVWMFPREKDDTGTQIPMSTKELGGKFTVSVGAGTMLTPMLMQWWQMPLVSDWCLGTAFLVALLSWGVLKLAVPIATMVGVKWFDNKTNRILVPPDYKDPNPPPKP